MLNRDDGFQGSVFSFSFPYCPDPQKNAPQFMQSQQSVLRTATSASDISDNNDEKVEGNDKVDVKNVGLNGLLHESAKEIPSKSLQSVTTSMPPLRILVVDDSPSIVKVAKRFLTEHGHTVDTAENGNEALAKLKQVRAGGNVSIYDMMLTDIQMPVLDGMECTKHYRQWESEGAIAVAVTSTPSRGANTGTSEGQSVSRLIIMGMSANNDDEVAREGLAMGMDGFIGKVLYCYPSLSSLFIIPHHHFHHRS